jgi:acid phosphatase type 7
MPPPGISAWRGTIVRLLVSRAEFPRNDPVIAAAGNIACDPVQIGQSSTACHMDATSDLLVTGQYDAVLALGDNQYICAGYGAFQKSFDPTWGRVYERMYPVPGDKEYRSAATAPDGTDCSQQGEEKPEGFRQYFGDAPGRPPGFYYSFNVGQWHLVALNSACLHAGGCKVGSPQYRFLVKDLASHKSQCTLVFWHHPRFSSGAHGNDARYADWWEAMYRSGVDLTLHAHEHTYERFAPQTPDQLLDAKRGIRQFIVGTGGHSHVNFPDHDPQPNSEVRNDNTFGILELVLHPNSYEWQFVPEDVEGFSDSGQGDCH